MISELDEIKKLRKKIGLTQIELAKKACVSQSLIAKIEAGLLDPGYTKTKQIFDALEAMENDSEINAGQIMNKKIITAKIEDKVGDIILEMKKYAISQLPIMSGDKPVGLITEGVLLDKISSGKDVSHLTAKEIMDDCPPIINPQTKVSVVANLLKHFSIVIVAEKGVLLGVISKSDLIEKII